MCDPWWCDDVCWVGGEFGGGWVCIKGRDYVRDLDKGVEMDWIFMRGGRDQRHGLHHYINAMMSCQNCDVFAGQHLNMR